MVAEGPCDPTWAGGPQPAGPQRALHQAWPAYTEAHLSVIFTVVLLYTDLWEPEKFSEEGASNQHISRHPPLHELLHGSVRYKSVFLVTPFSLKILARRHGTSVFVHMPSTSQLGPELSF